MHEQAIERFATGGERLTKAVAGLGVADVTQRLAPGKWSILELVVHLADSDAVVIDRMKRILTEENPPLLSFDEEAYVARLHYGEQSLEDALLLINLGRRQFARVLRRLKPEEFARRGTHNRAGVVTVGELIEQYTDHLDHHLGFLLGKRRTLGKPLPG